MVSLFSDVVVFPDNVLLKCVEATVDVSDAGIDVVFITNDCVAMDVEGDRVRVLVEVVVWIVVEVFVDMEAVFKLVVCFVEVSLAVCFVVVSVVVGFVVVSFTVGNVVAALVVWTDVSSGVVCFGVIFDVGLL